MNIFDKLDKIATMIFKKIKKYEFKTFVIGTRLSSQLSYREEELWENVGIETCEPIKAEINRELGKCLEKMFRKDGKKINVDFRSPDIVVLVNLSRLSIDVQINPIFIRGDYCKLIRGIPQTKWKRKIYKTSVEEIIAKPLLKATRGKDTKFHGAGREDIDVRCFGWRPFVIEILEPKYRKINLKEIENEINKTKKVKVRNLRFTNIQEVRFLKEAKFLKTYRLLVECEREISSKELRKLKQLECVIKQQTPKRVLRRRSDKIRKRRIYKIKVKKIDRNKFEIFVTCDAGLYVREVVTGDENRTNPSVSSILGCNCNVIELDVLKIHTKTKSNKYKIES
jgi:tRNA pseudouridine synthase 10